MRSSAAERLFDVRDALIQTQLRLLLLLLHGVGAAVERQHEEVHHQAQHDDGQARIADQTLGHHVDYLKEEPQRPDQQRPQN